MELTPVVLYFHVTEARHGKAEDDTLLKAIPWILKVLNLFFYEVFKTTTFSFFLLTVSFIG